MLVHSGRHAALSPKVGTLLAGVAFFSLVVCSGRAVAQETQGPSFAFNVGAASDYVFRGFSQTDEDPQVFGGLDASYGIAYAGVWASNVDFRDSTDVEFDLYAGVKPSAGPVIFDLGVIYYGYADQPSGADYDYWEGKVAASVPAGPATLGAAVYYSPDFFGVSDEAWYYEANAVVAIPNSKFTVSGALGRQEQERGLDYTTWNVGVGYALTDHVTFDVRYADTNASRAADPLGWGDGRVVGGAKLIW